MTPWAVKEKQSLSSFKKIYDSLIDIQLRHRTFFKKPSNYSNDKNGVHE